MSVTARSETTMAQFHDIRLEAWRAEPPQDGWKLIPSQAAPFAIAGTTVDGSTASGVIRLDAAPGVDWAEVIVTGIAPNGNRYILSADGAPSQVQFRGNVLSWFAASLTRQ